MRKAQKKQIIEIMDSLSQAHKEIGLCVQKGEIQNAQAGLADCQDCMLEVGRIVEETEGEDCQAVHAMESYCEELFLQYNQLENPSEGPKPIQNALQARLKVVIRELERIPLKKEVVFLPYKASMWDSLESIYLAAKEDGSCDAYCVPIPYYDLLPDGSFGELHYEGNEYPKNIEITDYRTYNLEERKPDIVYIHNPYDNWNRVTSVLPRFYASNLKKYTDELVYVPYFILQEIEPDDQPAIDGMKHFIWTPGVIYADKVIVQSEKMAQIYINEYLKEAKACGVPADRHSLEKKILGLGSPKIDKVLNTKKEDLEIPEEWLKIIEKPDGSFKKIVFYNTSLNALLKYNEQMLEKMKDVFRIFYENKEEVALLWRPHPLIENTIKSMRPQLWEEYKKLVEWYKKEGFGIYDDTADMDRAVVLSDAYYGDRSSVVQVYQKTGKPVMVQDVSLKYTSEKMSYPVWMMDFVIIDNKMWFLCEYINMLFCYSLDNKSLELVDVNPEGGLFQKWSYGACVSYQNKIFFIPSLAQNIVIYDIDKRKFTILELYNVNIHGRGKFWNSCCYNGKLYCVPRWSHSFVIIDCENMKIEYDIEWTDLLDNYKEDVDYIIDAAITDDGVIVALLSNGRDIIKFECETRKMERITLEEKSEYSAITSIRNQLVLYDKKLGELHLKQMNDINTQYVLMHDEKEEVSLCAIDEKIIIDNKMKKNMRMIYGNGEKIFQIENDIAKEINFVDTSLSSGIAKKKTGTGDIIYFDYYDKNLYWLRNDKLFSKNKVEIDRKTERIIKEYLQTLCNEGKPICENPLLGLKDILLSNDERIGKK